MDLKETEILKDDTDSHWYYKSKAAAMAKLIDMYDIKNVLDVGAGSGFFSKYILNNMTAKEAWCIDISYDENSDIEVFSKPLHYRKSIDYIDADLVLLMDVLEHVDDDVGLLKEYVAKVPKGAIFLISVPAFEFLWSNHDIFLEHKRRYTLGQLEDVAERAGLKIMNGNYYFLGVFPAAASIRLIKKLLKPNLQPASELKKHSVLVNSALSFLSRIELIFYKKNRLGGLTVFCVAKKL